MRCQVIGKRQADNACETLFLQRAFAELTWTAYTLARGYVEVFHQLSVLMTSYYFKMLDYGSKQQLHPKQLHPKPKRAGWVACMEGLHPVKVFRSPNPSCLCQCLTHRHRVHIRLARGKCTESTCIRNYSSAQLNRLSERCYTKEIRVVGSDVFTEAPLPLTRPLLRLKRNLFPRGGFCRLCFR